jgi:Mce-associated membrane protein
VTEQSPTRWRLTDFVLVELVVLGLLSVLAVAIGGASALPWTTTAERNGATNRDAVVAAERLVNAFLDVDHRHVDEDAKKVLAASTDPFRQQFAINATDLRIAVVSSQSVSRGTIRAAGVERVDGSTARVLVAADTVVTSRATKRPKRSHHRFVVSVREVDGRWLASNLAEER